MRYGRFSFTTDPDHAARRASWPDLAYFLGRAFFFFAFFFFALLAVVTALADFTGLDFFAFFFAGFFALAPGSPSKATSSVITPLSPSLMFLKLIPGSSPGE